MPSLIQVLQNMRQAAAQIPQAAAPPVFGAAQAHTPLASHSPLNLTLPAGWTMPAGPVQPHPGGAGGAPLSMGSVPLPPAQAAAIVAAFGAGGAPQGYVQSPAAGMAGDRYNPAARAYAKQRLHAAVRAGVISRYLPEWDTDPAAAWRGVSQLMAQSGYFNRPLGVNPQIVAE